MNLYESVMKNLKEGQEWYGIPGIKWLYHGDWADPEIEVDGLVYNVPDLGIEDSMWYELQEQLGRDPSDSEFQDFMLKNGDDIKADLVNYVPVGVAEWVTDEIQYCYSYDDLMETLKSFRTKTAIPERIIELLEKQIDPSIEDGEDDAIDQVLAVLDQEIRNPEYYNV